MHDTFGVDVRDGGDERANHRAARVRLTRGVAVQVDTKIGKQTLRNQKITGTAGVKGCGNYG